MTKSNKLVLFDVDRTLFDRELFRDKLYPRLAKALQYDLSTFTSFASEIEEQIKKRFGHFVPHAFLEELHKSSDKTTLKELETIFWDSKLYRESLYPEAIPVLKELQKHNITLGIFSKGEQTLQEKKIEPIKEFFDPQHIYFFPDKIKKLPEVFTAYKDYDLYFIDDLAAPLAQAKKHMPSLFTIQTKFQTSSKHLEQNHEQFSPDLIITQLSEIIPPITKGL